jgi:TetR/AcrR family tetracycline transcriptional repressor
MSTMTASTASDTAAPGRRRPLTRHDVLMGGLTLVDRDGLEQLSMRKLAADLGVEAMSLYRHVASKDDLLAGIADLVWTEIAAAAPPDDDWSAWLQTFGHAIRDAVHRHPDALPALVAGDVGPLSALELFADQLDHAGASTLDRDRAVSAMRTVAAFALGCVVTERSCFGPAPAARDESERQRLLRVSRALPPDTSDRILDVAVEVCGDCDAGRLFSDGLDLIVRGCIGPT